jgi:hypothetical protein
VKWWRFFCWFALWVLLSASSPVADPPWEGLDFKGFLSKRLSHRSCVLAVRSLAGVRRPAVSFPWRTFGTNAWCAKRFTRRFRGRKHLLAIDLLNNTCHKWPGRCEKRSELFARRSPSELNAYILSGKGDTAIRGQIRDALHFANAVGNGNTEFVLFDGLEVQYKEPVLAHLLGLFGEEWPFGVGHNPMRDDGLRGTFVVRLHSSAPHCARGLFASNDGFPLTRGEERGFVETGRAHGCGGIFLFRGAASGRPGPAYVPPLTRVPSFTTVDLSNTVNAFR